MSDEPIEERDSSEVMIGEGGPVTLAAPEAPTVPQAPAVDPVEAESSVEPAEFPTLISKGGLARFRVSCAGQPTLEGEAVDESEAIRAYKLHLNLEAAQHGHGARLNSFTAERLEKE